MKSEKLIMNDQKCAEVFNNYFNSIAKELNIPIDQNLLNDACDASIFDDPIIAAVHKYKRLQSILKIKEKVKKNMKNLVNPEKMFKILQNVDSKKATQQCDMPVRIMQETKFTLSKNVSEMFNFYIDNNTFPNGLKKADIKPMYKKGFF